MYVVTVYGKFVLESGVVEDSIVFTDIKDYGNNAARDYAHHIQKKIREDMETKNESIIEFGHSVVNTKHIVAAKVWAE